MHMFKNKTSKDYSLLTIIGIIIILTAILGSYGYSSLNKGSPKIEIAPMSYDFGDMPYEKVEHAFIVKNTGAKPLEIKGVSTSCGCTKATIDSEIIQPGKAANLHVSYDPKIMGDESGSILRVIYVKSNDPRQPEVDVKITANVLKKNGG